MIAPLEFYPSPSIIRTNRLLAWAMGAVAAFLVWTVTLSDTAYRFDWIATAAIWALALVCATACWFWTRTTRRMENARAGNEPQLVLNDFGILLRDGYLWRRVHIPWSRIDSISAVPDDKGVSIRIAGDLKPYGRLADIFTDTSEQAEILNARLARFENRLRRRH